MLRYKMTHLLTRNKRVMIIIQSLVTMLQMIMVVCVAIYVLPPFLNNLINVFSDADKDMADS